MMNLEAIQLASPGVMNVTQGQQDTSSGGGFDQFFKVIQHMNNTQVSANNLMTDVMLGKSEDTHGAMIALEKASIQMDLMVKVRTELTDGYNKLINIQL